MRLWKRIAGKGLRKAARYKLIDKIATFIYESGRSELPDSAARSMGIFTDNRGYEHELLPGLRDWLKPDWRAMFGGAETGPPPDIRIPDRSVATARLSVERALHFLGTLGRSVEGKSLLEVGCYNGTRAFALAGLGAGSVTATDIPQYYLNQKERTGSSPRDVVESRREQERLFRSGAEAFERLYGMSGLLETVRYLEDDICDSRLPADEFDMVFSWEVLEHVQRPDDLFRNTFRILRPGGTSFHEYNPFYSLNGGHSLGTLDFLWGHARLSTEDIRSYLREYRPGEEEVAMRFLTRNLNRMSHADLRRFVREAGLELLAFIPWYNEHDEKHLNRDVLVQVRDIYPTVTAEDLLARNVWVVVSKPV